MKIINIQTIKMSRQSVRVHEKPRCDLSREEKIQYILETQNRPGNYVPEYKRDPEEIFITIVNEIVQKMYYYAKRDGFDLDRELPQYWDECLIDHNRMPNGVYMFLDSLDVYDKTDIILSGLKARHDDFVWGDGKNYAVRDARIRYVPFELLPADFMMQGYDLTKNIFDQFALVVDEKRIETEFLTRKDEYLKVNGIEDLMSLMRFFNNIHDHYAPSKGFAELLKEKSMALSLASEVTFRGGC